MKRFMFLLFLFVFIGLPVQASAEQAKSYLVYGSEKDIEEIKASYPTVLQQFEELPMVELELTTAERNELQTAYKSAEIYPNHEYEIAADFIPSSYKTVKATPAEAAPFTGEGVRVAVLDTGIDTNHPDLKVAGGTCTAAACATGIPYDDNFGHGTHVAGIIAAKADSKGMRGIAPGVEIYAIKAMNHRSSGSTAQITKGVEWAIENKIDILNLSISIATYDRPLELMLQRAYEEGMIIVSAAGNTGADVGQSTVTYPGKYDSTIAVGSLDAKLQREPNSSYGPEVEIAAPGLQIHSTYPFELDDWDDAQDGYMKMSGTSMAAPHVTAVMALYKEQYPGLTNEKYREIIRGTARDLGEAGRDDQTGFGLVQYEKSIEQVVFAKATVNKGHIRLELQNKEQISDWILSEDNKAVAESGPGVWNFYKTKGTYRFDLVYKDAQGNLINDKVELEVSEPAFPDVTMTSWFAPHISYLYSFGMIGGYMDGSFKPRREITRAEAMILLGRAEGLDGTKRFTSFSDVGINHGASGYIQSALEKGIISGFPDGSFRPDQSVTRAEMALLIQSTYQFDYNPAIVNRFTDVHASMTSYEAIQALIQQGITQGVTATTFEPYEYMNRYMFSVFLARSENPELIIKD